jgi:hypothetical protein
VLFSGELMPGDLLMQMTEFAHLVPRPAYGETDGHVPDVSRSRKRFCKSS